MSFNRAIKFFLPKDKAFYPLFEEVVRNLERMAELLQKGVELTDMATRAAIFKQITDYEHENDQVTHKIFTELANNFITPFDREDIQALAVSLDDIADYINATAKKLSLYEFYEQNRDIMELSDLIYQSVLELKIAVKEIQSMQNPGRVKACCIRINDFENQADDVYERAVAVLFKVEADTKRIMILKEVLEVQETATDKCEDAANILESILIKYA